MSLDNRYLSTSYFEKTQRRQRTFVVVVALGIISVLFARLILAIDLGAISALLTIVAIVAVAAVPRVGLYVLFAIEMVFESASRDPLMAPGVYLNNSLQNTLGANGGILIPVEMLLILVACVWLAQGLMRHRLDYRAGTMGRVTMFFVIMLTFGVVRGLAGGAIFNYVFWESRFLFYIALCYVLAVNTIRTPGHVRTLLAIVFIGVGANGIEGVYRKFALADTGLLGATKEGWYAHDGVVFWGLLIIMVACQQIFGGPRWQRILGPILLIPTGFTMLASERRSGFIAVIVAFLLFSVVLFVVRRRAFFVVAAPILVMGAIYLPLFWNNTSMWGQPARAVRSIKDPDPRDASSNLARDLEAINVRATIASDPLLGIGFGRPFLQVVTIPDISFFPFWNYEAHHNILWVWMKTGAVGFTAFFVMMGAGIARATYLARTMHPPDARVFAFATAAAIVMSLVFCYVDLGLTNSRLPVLLGTMLGTVGVLERIYKQPALSPTT